jgi:hypothetical protein
MRRSALYLLIVPLFFLVGVASHIVWKSLNVPSWQYVDTLCGISDIENPLCAYSPSLREIPNVDFCSLLQKPEIYDGKIIRIQGTLINATGDLFRARLENQTCNSYETRVSVSYWNDDTISNIRAFLDTLAPESNRARVTVVGEFIDRAGDGYETRGQNRFLFIILRTEKISIAPVAFLQVPL